MLRLTAQRVLLRSRLALLSAMSLGLAGIGAAQTYPSRPKPIANPPLAAHADTARPEENPDLAEKTHQETPAFWVVPRDRVDDMVKFIPDKNAERYAHLRAYFVFFGCEPKFMEEQAIPGHKEKNLICVLPGADTRQIIVAARYPLEDKDKVKAPVRPASAETTSAEAPAATVRDARSWSAAVMLPLLYRALQAQSRRYTFVFVEMYGAAGEKEFLNKLGNLRTQEAKAIVSIDALGAGPLQMYTHRGFGEPPPDFKHPSTKMMLESEAVRTAQYCANPYPRNQTPMGKVDASLVFRSTGIPSILIYSTYVKGYSLPGPDQGEFLGVKMAMYHQNYDFLGYYLCSLDARLPIDPAEPKK